MMEHVLEAGTIHAMKDPTRGGFASAINEMAKKSGVGIRIQEEKLPIQKSVRSAAGMLGIDPLEVANEGKVVMGVPPSSVDDILAALHSHKYGRMPLLSAGLQKAPMLSWKQRLVANDLLNRPWVTRCHGCADTQK